MTIYYKPRLFKFTAGNYVVSRIHEMVLKVYNLFETSISNKGYNLFDNYTG